MFWASLIAILILIASFFGGIKEGAARSFFSLGALLIALPLAGLAYPLLAGALGFLPGDDWENFLGYFITLAIISGLLNLVFLPAKKAVQAAWGGGPTRLLGGLLSVFGAAIMMVVFTMVVDTFPIFGWLEEAVTGSGVLTWLVDRLGFVAGLMPEVFRAA